MGRPRLVIDGYNLIHATPELARLAVRDLELARDRLVAKLAAYRSRRDVRITVVFDGQDIAGQRSRQPGGVEVVFSRAPQTADQKIKSLLAKDRSPRSVTVVTSDSSIVCHARDCGASTVRSAEFAARLGRTASGSGPGRTVPSDKPEMTPAKVREWEEYFRKGRQV